jgi:hypothetical protein
MKIKIIYYQIIHFKVIVFNPEYVKKLFQVDGETPIRPVNMKTKNIFKLILKIFIQRKHLPGRLI